MDAKEEIGVSRVLDAAAGAYYFGVYPGDESDASEQEVRGFAYDVLKAVETENALAAVADALVAA